MKKLILIPLLTLQVMLCASCVLNIRTERSAGNVTLNFNARDSGSITSTSNANENESKTTAGKELRDVVSGNDPELKVDIPLVP